MGETKGDFPVWAGNFILVLLTPINYYMFIVILRYFCNYQEKPGGRNHGVVETVLVDDYLRKEVVKGQTFQKI